MPSEQCTWCGADVDPDDGFRAYEPVGERKATFCRLEHVIPWQIQDAHWDAGAYEGPLLDPKRGTCAHCGNRLTDTHVLLVRHRGEHRVPDDFCSVEHLAEWAKAGGRWR